MSNSLKILTSPMSADFGTCDTSGGTARQLRGTVVKYATLLLPRAQGVRRTHLDLVAVAQPWTSCWAVSQKCRPEGGATGVSTLGVGRATRERAATCRMP
eukprot:5088289-Prymnesium_polylepis.1